MKSLIVPPGGGPATRVRESGGTVLSVGGVSDGQYLRRSGSSIVGAAVSAAVPIEAAWIAATAIPDAFATFVGPLGYNNSTSLGTGTLRARPWVAGRDGTVTSLGTVCAVGVATSVVRIGIYEAGADGYPAGLVVESGELDCSTAGRKLGTGLSEALDPSKVYWLAALGGVAAANLRLIGTQLSIGMAFVGAADATVTPPNGIAVAQSYGALPATFPAGAASNGNTQNIPIMLVGIA